MQRTAMPSRKRAALAWTISRSSSSYRRTSLPALCPSQPPPLPPSWSSLHYGRPELRQRKKDDNTRQRQWSGNGDRTTRPHVSSTFVANTNPPPPHHHHHSCTTHRTIGIRLLHHRSMTTSTTPLSASKRRDASSSHWTPERRSQPQRRSERAGNDSQNNSASRHRDDTPPMSHTDFGRTGRRDPQSRQPLTLAESFHQPQQPKQAQQRAWRPEHQSRRKVSQFVRLWLRRDREWKQCVLEHLTLPATDPAGTATTNAEDDGTSSNGGASDAVMANLRRKILQSPPGGGGGTGSSGGNVYDDSMPSYADILEMTPTPELKQALDELVDVGLARDKVASDYRNTVRQRVQRQDIRRATREKEQQRKGIEHKYAEASSGLKELEQKLNTLAVDEPTPSLWEKTVLSISNMFQSKQEQQAIARATEKRTRELQTLHSLYEVKKQHARKHRITLDAVNTKISMMTDEWAKLEPPMSNTKYERIQAAANKTMPIFAKAFAEHIVDRHAKMLERLQVLDAKTDLTRPHEWFLHARLDRRKIVFHGGPTNSGKTYMALKRLKQAKKGMYLAPLRLLASEVYEKLTIDGVYCSLLTGQERREIPFATHIAATVEMAILQSEFDVVVIDEIQMIADEDRGFAWTRALLGSRCKEIHVCGGLEGLEIVKRIAKNCGDELEICRYERFSDLKIENHSLALQEDKKECYKVVKAGDCVVAFSRDDIFAIKREIEKNTKFKCSVIYGSLPPSTRSEQARRFNDPDSGFDVLVASDAIGMGLNLNIRRIIFNSIFKNNGRNIVRLDHSAMKQISGRAGRRNSPFPNGAVTTRDPRDMDYLRQCLGTEIQSIQAAGLMPTATHVETFSNALESYGITHGPKNLHKVLSKFNEMATMKSGYFLCKQDTMVNIAAEIASLDLSIPDKYIFCQSPVKTRNSHSMKVMKRFAEKRASGQVAGLQYGMSPKAAESFDDLARLCNVFSDLELFMWLQEKFPPANIMEMHSASARKEESIDMIGAALSITDKLKIKHCYVSRDIKLREECSRNESNLRFGKGGKELNEW